MELVLILNLFLDALIIMYIIMVANHLSSKDRLIRQEMKLIETLIEQNSVSIANNKPNTPNKSMWR